MGMDFTMWITVMPCENFRLCLIEVLDHIKKIIDIDGASSELEPILTSARFSSGPGEKPPIKLGFRMDKYPVPHGFEMKMVNIPLAIIKVRDKELIRDLWKVAKKCTVPEAKYQIFELACVLRWIYNISADDPEFDFAKLFDDDGGFPFLISRYSWPDGRDDIDYVAVGKWIEFLEGYEMISVDTDVNVE